MGYQNKESLLIRQNFHGAKKERLRRKSDNISLKNMPLETRRKEANKPLFLIRYE